MKTRSRKACQYSFLSCISFTLFLVSCGAAGGLDGMLIDRIPVFSGETITSRSAIPLSTPMDDLFFSIFTPPLTRFKTAPSGTLVGDTITVDLFGNPVDLSTSEDNGVIVFSGSIVETASDASTVETGLIEIRYDPTSSDFSMHSEILMTDPDNQAGWGSDMYFYIIVDVPTTSISADDSFITRYEALALLGKPQEIQYFDTLEMFSGSGGVGQWIVGFGGMTFTSTTVTDIGLDPADFGSMVDPEGTPLSYDQITPIRQAIVNLKTDMPNHIADNGKPALGFRTYSGSGHTTKLYIATENHPSEDKVYIVTPWDPPERLVDSNGQEILLPFDAGDSTIPAKTLSNVSTFISGFPASTWRENSSLIEIYTAKGFSP